MQRNLESAYAEKTVVPLNLRGNKRGFGLCEEGIYNRGRGQKSNLDVTKREELVGEGPTAFLFGGGHDTVGLRDT